MPIRTAEAHWSGGLKKSTGVLSVESGAFESKYSAGSRFEDVKGTNPEELIGAAHAGCFSMALSMLLEQAGFNPERIDTRATVYLDSQNGGFKITRIKLDTEGQVPGIDAEEFEKQAEEAKATCPVSQALAGVDIALKAQLK